MKFITRIMSFESHDWEHIWWLCKNMCKRFVLCDFEEAHEAWLFIKLHFSYDSKLIGEK